MTETRPPRYDAVTESQVLAALPRSKEEALNLHRIAKENNWFYPEVEQLVNDIDDKCHERKLSGRVRQFVDTDGFHKFWFDLSPLAQSSTSTEEGSRDVDEFLEEANHIKDGKPAPLYRRNNAITWEDVLKLLPTNKAEARTAREVKDALGLKGDHDVTNRIRTAKQRLAPQGLTVLTERMKDDTGKQVYVYWVGPLDAERTRSSLSLPPDVDRHVHSPAVPKVDPRVNIEAKLSAYELVMRAIGTGAVVSAYVTIIEDGVKKTVTFPVEDEG